METEHHKEVRTGFPLVPMSEIPTGAVHFVIGGLADCLRPHGKTRVRSFPVGEKLAAVLVEVGSFAFTEFDGEITLSIPASAEERVKPLLPARTVAAVVVIEPKPVWTLL